ncbi:C4-dicarboxylate ABC transporter [Pseudoteredinibacter isoporae]|uniref:Na+/H+ antiporter NhaC n=2 Tax=Pseudoteredinibacter isoporae TaxID=570281 RepID=A0A7X0JUQ2_9GAMM|nr:Na+/H+ antiporter NhaC family protein [Pseudoteredinibacter isoporae]MBB6521785.1 Na+/H+ antiporter NhaC [Pseudoteredinibacter isoporae]NHO87331.1 C4-dicarboxylate ABC transporter [Pseudoteredinibacter isoporae]NIB23037.1 C4-dicarboxylate ABC transporter [Pseudoteredinibacter isoporae]
MQDLGVVVLLPSLLAIVLAIWTRKVFVALIAGIWLGCYLLGGNPIAAIADSIDRIVNVLASAGDARVVLFTLCVGGLIALIEANGGVRAFVNWLEAKRWGQSRKQAQGLAWLSGVLIFIESNITVLVAATTAKPLFDRFNISRAKLAYIIDSTSAPICILIPFNAWGAFNLGLLSGAGVEDPLSVFFQAVLLNFYAIFAVLLAAAVIALDLNWGPMKASEQQAKEIGFSEHAELSSPENAAAINEALSLNDKGTVKASSPLAMLLPVLTLILVMPLGLWITGDGDLRQGSGSTSVLWAVLAASAVAASFMWRQQKNMADSYFSGAGKMVPVALVLMLALALGAISRELQAGDYLAQVLQGSMPTALVLPVVFILASAVAFAIGSSWGTFSLLIPLAVPLAASLDLPLAALVAAVLSGGVFGDHASPISDTTVISSMAAEVDHIEHVRTQLPYALLAASAALVGFLMVGLLS